eukprot:CAMPEP_0176453386 /NCGR_PEP_ID=MMETSP0127-20121128/29190_1 /TAXON_ID=938130 /ORGANISM="Platyophrya macrostoma, Strain WH" /LENGTH=473 /DNA_ID=CAMNT_0017842201 /DNA_START=172 /DNA_END=1589 /DNA_ORIENTATION=-
MNHSPLTPAPIPITAVGADFTGMTPLQTIKNFIRKVKEMTVLKLLFIALLITLVTAGNAMQIIGLNFWLRKFPAKYGGHSGAFTTFAVSGFLFGMFFVVLLVAYIAIKRPCMKFARSIRGLILLLGIGLMDTINSAMAIYAANFTPEVLQALFTSLMPIYTCVFSKFILRDKRTYFNRWVIAAFLLMIVGVVAASITDFTDTSASGKRRWWCVIFFLSIPPTSLMNVWQTKYMIMFTKAKSHNGDGGDTNRIDRDAAAAAVGSVVCVPSLPPSPQQEGQTAGCTSVHHGIAAGTSDYFRRHHYLGEDTAVKLFMLFADTVSQFTFTLFLLPLDAVPFWGGAKSTSEAWTNFSDGIHCLIHCNENFAYCVVYSAGFVFTYIGSAYLNHYSATLCSMIGQLSSPFTALLLIIAPSLNVAQGSTPWYWSAVAIVLLAVGTLLYSVWEEMTSAQAPDADGVEQQYEDDVHQKRERPA